MHSVMCACSILCLEPAKSHDAHTCTYNTYMQAYRREQHQHLLIDTCLIRMYACVCAHRCTQTNICTHKDPFARQSIRDGKESEHVPMLCPQSIRHVSARTLASLFANERVRENERVSTHQDGRLFNCTLTICHCHCTAVYARSMYVSLFAIEYGHRAHAHLGDQREHLVLDVEHVAQLDGLWYDVSFELEQRLLEQSGEVPRHLLRFLEISPL